jgi:hypothetical protein
VKPEKTLAASGKELHRSFYGRPGQGQEIEDYLAPREDMIMRESPSRRNDLMVATIAGLLAWVITLALCTVRARLERVLSFAVVKDGRIGTEGQE